MDPQQKVKRILLAGVKPQEAETFQAQLGPEVLVWAVGSDDTLSTDMVENVNVVVMNLDQGESIGFRLARQITESGCKVFLVGNAPPSRDLLGRLPSAQHFPGPVDFPYLRGILDAAQIDSDRLKFLDEEQSRVRGLYEVSSALLKVTTRMHIAPVMDSALPGLINAHLILLVFPADPQPIVFLNSPHGLSPHVLEALRVHLKEAWDILRSDMQVDWGWLGALANVPDDGIAPDVRPSSFMTTPISSGAQTRGFLTVLPRHEEDLNESFLQTFFVIGDLISVVIHNLELRERLEDRAMHDGLTKLLNHQTLIEQLERECRRSQRYGQAVCIVMFDLDHFKSINDTHGHQAGDEVLRVVANRLRDSIREMDIAGRMGGEEFITVLINTDLEGGRMWADRFRASMAEECIEFEGKEIHLTASFGVSGAAGEGAVVRDLIARADTAMYEAKRGGRNAVVTDGIPATPGGSTLEG